MSTTSIKLEDVIVPAIKERFKKRAEELLNQHKKQIEKELADEASKIANDIGIEVSKLVDVETHTDRLVITVHKKT